VTRVLKVLAPGAVLVIATTVVLAMPAVVEPLAPLAPILPLATAAIGVPLAVAFRRGRVALALLSVGVAAWAFGSFVASPEAADALAHYAYAAVAVMLPLNLAVIAWLRERDALSAVGVQRLVVFALEVGFVAFVWAAYHPRLIALPEAVFADPGLTAWTRLPQPAVAAFLLASVVILVRFLVSGAAVEAGFWWALLAAFVAFHGESEAGLLWLAVAALALVVAVVQAATSLAFADGLTGLRSRRALEEDLRRLPERFAVAMVDIDRFKAINDHHGHDIGDQLLRMVAGRLQLVGGGGRAYRYGGEEFAVLFPGRGAKEAAAFVDAVRLAIAETPFTLRSPERPRRRPRKVTSEAVPRRTVRVSISAGVAERVERGVGAETIIEAADKAMYRAKAAGRNRVVH
jgi:diguanylate cyclase (GGDEF)-like protein